MTALDYRSAAAPSDQPTERSRGHWLLWAIYLAMSWTWCIGMFLPVLLVRDFGFWGWVVFAVPNVVGAAAMGWVLDAETSTAAVRAHLAAARAFSIVTVVFQVFFGFWLFRDWFDRPMLPLVVFAIAGATFFLGFTRFSLYLPVLVAATSYWCASRIILHPVANFASEAFKSALHWPRTELVGLAISCVFGFALCPYLDLSFHRARQNQYSDSSARLAFGIGFGIFFLSMISFSLTYAHPLVLLFTGATLAPLLGPHFLGQLGFTIGVHWRELFVNGKPTWRWLLLIATAGIGVLIALGIDAFSDPQNPFEPLSLGEIIYRLFMSFYGLVFPAYVWLCMIPGRWVTPPTRRQLVVWLVAVVVAAPMFWMAFIRGQMVWAVPGVCVVLLSRLAIGRTPRATLP
jgi:hypothetical protein